MTFSLSPYVGTPFLAAVISADVASCGWRYQNELSGRWLTALMISAGCWSPLETFFLLADSPLARLLQLALEPIPAESSVLFTLLFAFEIAGYERWVPRRTAVLFAVWPMFVIMGVVTNALGVHALLWESLSFATAGGITTTGVVPGPLFWVDVVHSYVVIGAMLVVLDTHCLRSRQIHREQALVLLVATPVPAVTGAIYPLIPFPSANPTVTSLVATSSLLATGLSRYRILDISPIMHDLIIERMTDPVLIVNRKGRLVGSNPTVRALLDVSHSLFSSLVVDASDPEIVEVFESSGELRVVGDNGGAWHSEVDWSAAIDGRDAVRSHLHTLYNIIERRVRERWLRVLTENASDPTLALDADGSVTYLSDSAAQTLRASEDPSEMRSLRRFLHPDDEDTAIEMFREALERPDGGATAELRFRSSIRGWCVFGVRYWNLLNDPVVGGVIVNAQDTTDRRRHEQQLETFADIISHDLRNPLNMAGGYLGLVKGADHLGSDHVERIEAAHERMGEIIADVLTLARGRAVGEHETVSPDVVAAEVWTNVETGVTTPDIVEGASFDTGRTRLLQPFKDLFRNAVEHGSTGSRDSPDDTMEYGSTGNQTISGDVAEHVDDGVTVTVDATRDGLFVKNGGPGVPLADHPKPFESGFMTADDDTGFGPAVARTIADTHGWSVGYEDAVDAGVRLVIHGVERAGDLTQESGPTSSDDT